MDEILIPVKASEEMPDGQKTDKVLCKGKDEYYYSTFYLTDWLPIYDVWYKPIILTKEKIKEAIESHIKNGGDYFPDELAECVYELIK
jgi:hypothetical protein